MIDIRFTAIHRYQVSILRRVSSISADTAVMAMPASSKGAGSSVKRCITQPQPRVAAAMPRAQAKRPGQVSRRTTTSP